MADVIAAVQEIVEVPNPNHPFGVKGVGEANIVPAMAAVANAVAAAVGRRMDSYNFV